MTTVFVVQHLHTLPNGIEDIKLIGVYSSKESALTAVDRLKSRPGFCENPRVINPGIDDDDQGFYVDEYSLDDDNWTEGYITV